MLYVIPDGELVVHVEHRRDKASTLARLPPRDSAVGWSDRGDGVGVARFHIGDTPQWIILAHRFLGDRIEIIIPDGLVVDESRSKLAVSNNGVNVIILVPAS